MQVVGDGEVILFLDRQALDVVLDPVVWKGDALPAGANLDETETERCYLQAIDVARSQSDKSW